MGLFGFGSRPGKGHTCDQCDYCNRGLSRSDSDRLPHIGNSAIMNHNRYFCSVECLKAWRDQYQYYGD